MNERHITDRIEGGKGETGITDRPPDHGPYALAPIAVRRRGAVGWGIAVVFLVVPLLALGGAIYYFQYIKTDDYAISSFASQAAYVAIALVTAGWLIFFTGLRWRTRFLLAGIGVLVLVGLGAAFRMDGATGDMGFRFVPRWQNQPDMALPNLSNSVAAAPRDVTIHPGDFPQFLGPDRDAIVHGVELERDWTAHPPREVWRQPVGAGWSAFAVAGDLAITQEQRGAEELVVARDRKTGEPVWSHGNGARFSEIMGGDGPRATPTITDGKVYALGATGVLDCLEGSTGKLIWSHDTLKESGESNLQWGKSCSPLVIGDLGLVVVSLGAGGRGGSLAAYDVKTGERKWTGGDAKASYASPLLTTLAGWRQIVMVNEASVSGHDLADGKVLWEYQWKFGAAKASQPPVLPGDRLLLTAGYDVPGVLLQVKRDGDKWTTEEVWTTNHMRTKFTTPVVRDHYAYGLDDGALTCIDLDDGGKQVWQVGRPSTPNRYGHGQVLLVDDLLLVQAESGEVVLAEASPKGFHKLGELPAFKSKTWNNPALAGGRLFVRNDQEAACYELATVENVGRK
jgi:outer membrane protein assembly factor BamB